MKQLELFSQDIGGVRPQGREHGFFFLKNHEKFLLTVIGLIVTAAVAFCAGVETGKNKSAAAVWQEPGRTVLKSEPRTAAPAVKRTVPVTAPQQPAVTVKAPSAVRQPVAAEATAQKKSGSEYTVQVASFSTRTLAENELRRLKTRGFAPRVVSKGKFTIVCVGNFADKEQAKSVLSRLKGTYSDCYIRRL